MNAKVIGAIVAAAFAAGIGTYILMKRETDRLRTEHQSLIAKCERVALGLLPSHARHGE
jgi:hypothetical protein